MKLNQNTFENTLDRQMISFGIFTGVNNGRSVDEYRSIDRNSYFTRSQKASFTKIAARSIKKLSKVAATVVESYKQKQELRNLLKLSDHYIHDIGLNRIDLETAILDGTSVNELVAEKKTIAKSNSVIEDSKAFEMDRVESGICANDILHRAA